MNQVPTPFERNLLPKFAKWFEEKINDEKPDIILPVERKGAHLLDAVMAYLRSHAGRTLRSQIIYRRAMLFSRVNEFHGKTVSILDDATQTGTTLHKYRDIVNESGNVVVSMAACIGVPSLDGADTVRTRNDVQCFLKVSPELYKEYLREIVQFVISRGLPPELDHHVFSITPNGSATSIWWTLLDKLRTAGNLDLNGPVSADGMVHAATLHRPRFFPKNLLPAKGAIASEGIIKLKLFADFLRNRILVVPMVFPKLEIATPPNSISTARCESLYQEWPGASAIGAMLFDDAPFDAHAAEILYYAVSLTCEVAMMKGLETIISHGSFAQCIECETEGFARLYGPNLGSKLVKLVNRSIGTAPRETETYELHARPSYPLDFYEVNQKVGTATDAIIKVLKSSYLQANEGVPRHEWRTVGYDYTSLKRLSELQGDDHTSLLVSRCIDFGCSIASLVPFVDAGWDPQALTYTAGRKYRTSETTHIDGDKVEDARTYYKEVADETIATVIHFLNRRSDRWPNAVPHTVLVKVLSILLKAIPEALHCGLTTFKNEHGPDISYKLPDALVPPKFDSLKNVVTEHFKLNARGEFEVSPTFIESYENKSLRVAHRGDLRLVESYLSVLVPVLNNSKNVDDLLICWSASAGRKLGLDYAMADVYFALRELQKPAEVLARGDQLQKKRLALSSAQALHYLGIAQHEKIDQLQTGWSVWIRENFKDPIFVESELMSTLCVPSGRHVIYDLANLFCQVVAETAKIISQLPVHEDHSQGQLFSDGPDKTERLITAVHCLKDLEQRLIRMKRFTTDEHIDTSPERATRNTGLYIKNHLHTLRSFAQSYGGEYLEQIAWRPRGVANPVARNRFVLFGDLKGSTPQGFLREHPEYVQWKNFGLNLMSQWASSFKGAESIKTYNRHGDDIILEFLEPESALICAAIIQEHTRTLRATNAADLSFQFRMAIDCYYLTDADGGNVISSAIDRASKLAKATELKAAADVVRVTPEVVALCSERVQSTLKLSDSQIDLGADTSRAHFRPYLLDTDALIEFYTTQIREIL